MRHLYFILLFSYAACFSQQVKIMAYRLINEDNDGPCSIAAYLKEAGTDYFYSYVTAQSTDTIMANRLLAINREAKKKKGVEFWCEPGTLGGDMIHNMIVIEKDAVRDTIYLTRQNTYIVFPDEDKAYPDNKLVLRKSLTGTIKEFFDFDFQKDLRSMFMSDVEKIPLNKVFFKGKNIKGFTKNKFEKEFGKLNKLDENKSYDGLVVNYSFEGDIYSFTNDVLDSVEVNNPDSGWEIDGLYIGSKQELFLENYPISMSFNVISSKKFEDYKKKQLHWLRFNESTGSIGYWIKDGVLDRFSVFYN
ncbi:hypothetical protein Q763_04030 [Flavobacterium beibuense F44-8]|uniref:Uncharacterized protein n=1 Tax=Flavobacterium beibuense F44-8 TaxID=1406840 RepID=A0A0A2LV63_9FLAO|nr:hypothetical protein [Flavobacterium beibuense]KGO83186.1 hypothetical protein Q763_04030 [Flavobacterium beibuense F44-8]